MNRTEPFLQQHQRFLLAYRDTDPKGGEWLPNLLRRHDYKFNAIASEGDMKMAEVSVPGKDE